MHSSYQIHTYIHVRGDTVIERNSDSVVSTYVCMHVCNKRTVYNCIV